VHARIVAYTGGIAGESHAGGRGVPYRPERGHPTARAAAGSHADGCKIDAYVNVN
jgi:hypothetical protein